MVNKTEKLEVHFHAPLLSISVIIMIILLLGSNVSGSAQNISKYYTSSMEKNGMLYFISPQVGFYNKQLHSSFVYDITYLTSRDSTTVNFSYFDKSIRNIDSIAFISNNLRYSSKTRKIFIETRKDSWHYRYSSTISLKDLTSFFNNRKKPIIILYTQQGNVELTMSLKTWIKESTITKKILALILINGNS